MPHTTITAHAIVGEHKSILQSLPGQTLLTYAQQFFFLLIGTVKYIPDSKDPFLCFPVSFIKYRSRSAPAFFRRVTCSTKPKRNNLYIFLNFVISICLSPHQTEHYFLVSVKKRSFLYDLTKNTMKKLEFSLKNFIDLVIIINVEHKT